MFIVKILWITILFNTIHNIHLNRADYISEYKSIYSIIYNLIYKSLFPFYIFKINKILIEYFNWYEINLNLFDAYLQFN